jgi:hypothetical protein
LELFAKWYEAIEKFDKISKKAFTEEMKSKLVDFLQSNDQLPQEGKQEIVEKIQNWQIKFLTKG